MSYELDPELVSVMAALAGQVVTAPAPARGDWKTLRKASELGQAYLATLVLQDPDRHLPRHHQR